MSDGFECFCCTYIPLVFVNAIVPLPATYIGFLVARMRPRTSPFLLDIQCPSVLVVYYDDYNDYNIQRCGIYALRPLAIFGRQ